MFKFKIKKYLNNNFVKITATGAIPDNERLYSENIYNIFLVYENKLNIINNMITSLFQILWQSELRSSNFNVKVYNFFSKWHDSLMRTSFYDFLLKTKLLQDEINFARNYKKSILKRYEAVKKLETLKYFELWEKYDLIDYIDDRLKPKGYISKKKNI